MRESQSGGNNRQHIVEDSASSHLRVNERNLDALIYLDGFEDVNAGITLQHQQLPIDICLVEVPGRQSILLFHQSCRVASGLVVGCLQFLRQAFSNMEVLESSGECFHGHKNVRSAFVCPVLVLILPRGHLFHEELHSVQCLCCRHSIWKVS